MASRRGPADAVPSGSCWSSGCLIVRRAARRQADRAQENDTSSLAAEERRVDQGARPATQVPARRDDARRRRLRRERAASPPPTRPRPPATSTAFAGVEDVTGKASSARCRPGPQGAPDHRAVALGEQRLEQTRPGRRPAARGIADAPATGCGVHVTGPGGIAADSGKAFAGIDGKLLYVTLAVVIVILLLTYRSPVLWLLPVISPPASALFGAPRPPIYLLAKHAGLTVNAQSAGILTVLVFGAGTDYALLLIARYREELRRHEDRHEAMADALHRAGPAIVASAATVAIGMLCLLAAEMNSTKGLGPVCAIGVAVGAAGHGHPAAGAAGDLRPLDVLAGQAAYGSPSRPRAACWARVGAGISRRPRVVWVVTALVLGVLALGILGLKADGLSNKDASSGKPESSSARRCSRKHFPAGAAAGRSSSPRRPPPRRSRTALERHTRASPRRPRRSIKGELVYLEATLHGRARQRGAAGRPSTALRDARARHRRRRREGRRRHRGQPRHRDARHTTGQQGDHPAGAGHGVPHPRAAAAGDRRAVAADRPRWCCRSRPRSGSARCVFDHVFDFAGADAAFPLFVFVFLVALGIDYNIFLMTRVREEAHEHGHAPGRARSAWPRPAG